MYKKSLWVVSDTNYLYPARWGWINNNKNLVAGRVLYVVLKICRPLLSSVGRDFGVCNSLDPIYVLKSAIPIPSKEIKSPYKLSVHTQIHLSKIILNKWWPTYQFLTFKLEEESQVSTTASWIFVTTNKYKCGYQSRGQDNQICGQDSPMMEKKISICIMYKSIRLVDKTIRAVEKIIKTVEMTIRAEDYSQSGS